MCRQFLCWPLWPLLKFKSSLLPWFENFKSSPMIRSLNPPTTRMPLLAFHPISTHLTALSLPGRLEKPEKLPKSFLEKPQSLQPLSQWRRKDASGKANCSQSSQSEILQPSFIPRCVYTLKLVKWWSFQIPLHWCQCSIYQHLLPLALKLHYYETLTDRPSQYSGVK